MRILENLGRIDSMTGACNRGAFNDSLEALWKQAIRGKKPLGQLIDDIGTRPISTSSFANLRPDPKKFKKSNGSSASCLRLCPLNRERTIIAINS